QMEYKIRSILGSVTLTPDAAEKVRGTRLTVQAARRITLNIEEAVDEVSASLGLASLRVVPGDGKRIHLDVQTDADNEAGIVTAGPQIYQGRVQLLRDAVLVASEIDFQGRVDSATSGPKSLVARASGRIRFDEDVGGKAPLRELELDFLTAVQPTGRAEFGSGRVHTTGDIRINPDGRTVVTGVATVYSRTGDLIFETDSGNFVMGAGETATAIGTLAIRADDPDSIVIVADLNADRIEIAADTVGFVRRSSADVRVSGNAATPDGGSDINANEIDIDARVLATVGVGRDPVFGVPDPTQLPEFLAERPPGQRFAVVALKRDSTPLTSEDLTLTSGVVADWKPFGPTRADLSQVYWTPAPDPRVPPTLDDRVPDSQALAAVGILSREPTRAEFRQRLEGAGIYDDRVGASVAEPRLFAARTGEAVELYQRLFGANLENAPRVREALQAALERYRRESPLPRVVGFEFRRWIKNRPSSQFEAYTTLEDLDALFHAHRNSGLSRFEYRRIQHEWLLAIQPHGIGLDELAEAIFPSRYVRGSDILDIFGQ
ncbi:MAG: hypothetical protein O7G30_05730, partial [Proteobacteria bacterium]|nr:hypothetical protein [Pseudomonadota bacterium]